MPKFAEDNGFAERCLGSRAPFSLLRQQILMQRLLLLDDYNKL